jgi:putative transposase
MSKSIRPHLRQRTDGESIQEIENLNAPTFGRRTAQKAHPDISHFLMLRYNWIQPQQFNGGLAPAHAEEKFNVASGIS